MPLVIDCYNLLHTTMPAGLAGLDEHGLCDAIARSRWARQPVSIVCDGSEKPGVPAGVRDGGVEIVYSGKTQSADDLIEQIIERCSAPRRMLVVSNDRQVQKAASRRRAQVSSCEQFIGELVRDLAGTKPRSDGHIDAQRNTPLNNEQVDRWLREFGIKDQPGRHER